MLGPDFGSNHGSFSDVAGVSFRIEKSAQRRIMRSAPKQNVIPIISIDIKCIIIAGSIRAVCYYSVIRVIAI